MTALGTSSGKTLHLIDRTLGSHKGAGRVWLEGRRLVDAGFKAGVRYQVVTTPGESLRLRLSPRGDHKVSHKDGRPVVDVLTRALGTVDRMQVRFTPGAIDVTLHPHDLAGQRRMRRLNDRLAQGGKLRLGSVCHGGGVAADAILRGLGDAELRLAIEMNASYMQQTLAHGPAAAAAEVLTLEQDLRDVDPRGLPSLDVLEAGLPCVAASRAGRSKKHLDRPEDDPQVQDMAEALLEVIRATEPAVVVIENVPEFAQSDSADALRRRLARWGYTLHEHVLQGAQWSLEARNRWVLVATLGVPFDASLLVPGERPATLGAVLDKRVPAAAWRTTASKDAKEARDRARGNRFQQRFLTAASTSVPTLRRGYQRDGSTDPRLAHPSRPGYSRLLTSREHARIKGVPTSLVAGLSEKVAHEVLGQSVIAPSFVALGAAVAASVR